MVLFSLVKKGDVHLEKGKIIRKEEFSLLFSAKELIDEANKEAKEIIENARLEGEKLKKQGEEDGFQEGLVKFNEHILHLEDSLKILRHEMQKALLPLVLKATKRIIGELLELNSETVVEIVMQSVKSISQCRVVKLYVNKADIAALEASKDKIKNAFESLESLRIEENHDVAIGSCIIETERGILNATLDNQYRALERAMQAHTKKS